MTDVQSVQAAVDDWSAWIGKTEEKRAHIAENSVAALAATLDMADAPKTGDALRPGWHWLYFNPAVRQSEVGRDGHPKRGGFLPPIPLPRRMWAGSRIRYLAPLAIGSEAVRVSRIAKIDVKNGKRGQLVFVTVTHTIERGGSLCIEEEQDLVYLDPAPAGTTTPSPQPAPQGAEHVGAFATDPVLLFRYSALTFNGHRIHYDAPYARAEEGYPDLVVHGPLTATVLQGFASSCRPGEQMAGFRFRGASPIIVGSDVQLAARWNTDKQALDLWAQDANGGLLMEASATFNGAGQQ